MFAAEINSEYRSNPSAEAQSAGGETTLLRVALHLP